MSTPTDPHNPTPTEKPTDGHEPQELNTSAPANTQGAVSYGDSDAIAWDKAFTAEESNTQAPATPELSELSFDDAHSHNMSDSLTATGRHSATNTQGALLTNNPTIETGTDERLLGPTSPLEEGATFASAYSATGITELPEPASTEQSEPVTPVRTSVLSPDSADNNEHPHWHEDPDTPSLADLPDEPKGRAGAHVGSIFATLILIPLAWYLISDAGVRLNLVENNPWETGTPSITTLIEFMGGILAIVLLWLMARASTLGAQIWGLLLALAGLTAIVVPSLGKRVVDLLDQSIGEYNAFTGNIVHHLNLDLGSGRIALYGLAIFLTGLMIHLGRKSAARRAEAKTLRAQMLG